MEIGLRHPPLAAEMDACRHSDEIAWASGQAIFRTEERVVNGQGDVMHFDVIKVPLFNGQDARRAMVIIGRDITERKQAELALAASHNLLQTIIDTVPVRIFWKDLDLRYLGCNPLFARDAGLRSAVELIGQDDFQMTWASQAELYRADDRAVMVSGIAKLSYEEPQTTPDGQEIWLRTSKIPLRGAGSQVIGVIGIYEDITERKQAEDKLHLAASVFSHAREGIMITAADATIIEVNDAFCQTTGYSHDEVLGKNPRLLNSGRQSKAFYAALWRDLIEQGYWTGELWNLRKNGELLAVLQTISAIRDDRGNIRQFVALFSDITALKEHEQQLEHIAHYDALTKLPNRVLLADRLHQAMVQARRRGQPLGRSRILTSTASRRLTIAMGMKPAIYC
jgi:PAS domain S-box-containing protein